MTKKRVLAWSLVLSLFLTSCGGGASAATMHLRKTEGTVGVSDGEGKGVEPRENLGLYSGYGVDTSSESYAWIDLDDVKLTKLDQDSEIGITKEGKKLDIEVKAGSLFFNVTQPLADDESMNIRTSTMAVGIRGTCGWVTQDTAALLEGTVEVTAGEQSVSITAGEMAFFTGDGKLEVRKLYAEDVPAFVAAEIGDQFPLEPMPVIPYAEANGLSFTSEKSYTTPAYIYFYDPSNGEPITIDGLSITNVVDANYTIGDISVSEADADGMIQMTVPYHLDFTATITDDVSVFDGRFNWRWAATQTSLFDYYTGIIFPTKYMSEEDGDQSVATEITFEDVTYSIDYTMNMVDSYYWSDWVNVGGYIDEAQVTVSADFTYTVHMPKEYDGLCLRVYLPGTTEYSEIDNDFSEAVPLLEAVENINDYALIRVSDLM